MYAIAGWVVFSNATHLPCRGKGANMLKILVAESARREALPLEASKSRPRRQRPEEWIKRRDVDVLEGFDKHAFFYKQKAPVDAIPDKRLSFA
jgi:hypothetical protein